MDSHRNTKFPKCGREIAIVAINATIIEHWIIMSLCVLMIYPRELDEKTTGFRGIIMALNGSTAKPISNISHYNYTKLHDKHATYIPEGKKKLVIYVNYSPEMYII